MSKPSYKERNEFFLKYLSLGTLGTNISNKFALISLIGYIVTNMKKKKPDVTYYQVVRKLAEGTGIDEDMAWRIAIISEDFAFGCTEFPTFDLKPKDMPNKVKELLSSCMPF